MAAIQVVCRSARRGIGLSRPCYLSNNGSVAPLSTGTPVTTAQDQGFPLHYEWLTPQGADASHIVVFLHGLLGNGRNLRTMAKKICESSLQPGLLLDLRGHGNSRPLPNQLKSTSTKKTTFDACVQDLQKTFQQIPQITNTTPITLVGHSWGARLCLQYAYEATKQQNAAAEDDHHHLVLPPPKRVWLLDSVPGEVNESVERVIRAVTDLIASNKQQQKQQKQQQPMTDRKQVVEQLVSMGIEPSISQWLASTLQKKSDKTLEFGFDLDVINDLLPEFQKQDFLGILKSVTAAPPQGGGILVDLVRGGKNQGWTKEVMDPLTALEVEGSNFRIHTLPNAGHWVHVEDLPGLLNVMDVSP